MESGYATVILRSSEIFQKDISQKDISERDMSWEADSLQKNDAYYLVRYY